MQLLFLYRIIVHQTWSVISRSVFLTSRFHDLPTRFFGEISFIKPTFNQWQIFEIIRNVMLFSGLPQSAEPAMRPLHQEDWLLLCQYVLMCGVLCLGARAHRNEFMGTVSPAKLYRLRQIRWNCFADGGGQNFHPDLRERLIRNASVHRPAGATSFSIAYRANANTMISASRGNN